MSQPVKINEIDFNNLQLSKPKMLGQKKIIRFRYKGNRFLLQTPVIKYENEINKNNDICEINLPINCENEEHTGQLKDFLMKFDKFVINKGKENCLNWFGRSTQIKYKSIVRIAVNPSELYKNGVFKLKMKGNEEDIKITRNRQLERIEPSEIPRKCLVKAVIEPYAIWLNGTNFGVYIKPVLLDFRDLPEDIDFVEDSEDYDDIDILDTEMEFNIKKEYTESGDDFKELADNVTEFHETNSPTHLTYDQTEHMEKIDEESSGEVNSQDEKEKAESDDEPPERNILNGFNLSVTSHDDDEEIANNVINDIEEGIAEQVSKPELLHAMAT